MVADGEFRQDLYYRIAGLRIDLPPLRKRADKAQVILGALEIEARQAGYDTTPSLAPDTFALLMDQEWPGNMRELRLAVRYALAFSGEDEITVDRLPKWLNLDACDASCDAIAGPPSDDVTPPKLIEVLERNRWCISDAACELRVSRQTLYRWIKKQNLTRPA
jgi:transcriptional regulator of acetoin/glycerol metabolism